LISKIWVFFRERLMHAAFEKCKFGTNNWSKNVGRAITGLLCAKIIAVKQERVIAKTNQTMSGKGLMTRGTAAGMARQTQVKTRVGRRTVPKKTRKTVSGRKKEVPIKPAAGKEAGKKAGLEADNEEVEEVKAQVVGRKCVPGGGDDGDDDDDDDATELKEITVVDHCDLHHMNKNKKPVVGRKCAPGSGGLKDDRSY
jgi:hypothetical protein